MDSEHRNTFFSLPREIRDLIYELVCNDNQVYIQRNEASLSHTSTANATIKSSNSQTGMLSVCKQMRLELQPIYYSKTIFAFQDASTCTIWIKQYVRLELVQYIKYLRIMDTHLSPKLPHHEEGGELMVRFRMPRDHLIERVREDAARLLSDKKRMLGGAVMARLSMDAVQVMVMDVDSKTRWTATP